MQTMVEKNKSLDSVNILESNEQQIEYSQDISPHYQNPESHKVEYQQKVFI